MFIQTARRIIAEKQAVAGLKSNPRLWSSLTAYLERTRSTGCGMIDYWQLYKFVRANRPLEILECGPGASTVVLAHAVMENGQGFVTSMEESEEWFREAGNLIPKEWPVQVVLSDTVEDTFGLFRGIRYRNIPDKPYDFAFIDGPKYRSKDNEILFDFDFISIVRRSRNPVAAIIDKRVSTCFVLQRVLPGKVRYVPHLGLGFVEPVTSADLKGIDSGTPSKSFSQKTRVDFV